MASAWGELDHVIIFCDAGAPEATALIKRGLHEGPGNSHPGQGTVNRRFFFPNAYLELLWIENRVEALSAEARPVGLWDRWRQRAHGACPFGLVFRPGPRGPAVPPEFWNYSPKYFPPGFYIEVGRDAPVNEPLLFHLPFARPALMEKVSSTDGLLRIGPITGATVHLPQTQSLSPSLRALVSSGVVAVEPARDYLLDLLHAGGTSQVVDLRPQLALRLVPARTEQSTA